METTTTSSTASTTTSTTTSTSTAVHLMPIAQVYKTQTPSPCVVSVFVQIRVFINPPSPLFPKKS